MSVDGMHKYYEAQAVLPTHAAFAGDAALGSYVLMRERVMTERLMLPVRAFAGARLVEFGPDSGENSLPFAKWGAQLTLVEPNAKAWPRIDAYFERFGLQDRIERRVPATLQQFEAEGSYDFVDAEGFVFTVRPTSLWTSLFGRILAPGGIAILAYMEETGSIFESLLKVLHHEWRRRKGVDAVAAARELFQPKWDTIPHTRQFESWVMDVLENPWIRNANYLEPLELCREMADAGLALYSSWPVYADATHVTWHKRVVPADERLARTQQFVDRNRLGFLLGRRAFLLAPEEDVVRVRLAMRALARLVDQSIDGSSAELLRDARAAIADVRDVVQQGGVLTDEADGAGTVVATLDCLARGLTAVHDGTDEALLAFARTDELFLQTWGQPFHLAAFRKPTA